MGALLEEILLEMKSTAAEIARLEARLARQVVSFTRASLVRRGVAEELAMALCLTKFKADALIGHAEGLVDRFPLVLGLVEEGRVPMASAVAVDDAAAWLDDDKTPVVDGVVAGRLVGKNPTAARRSASAAVAKADPEGFEERVRRRREASGFYLHHGESGVAGLSLENAPIEKATAAYLCVDQQARLLKTPDETRTLDQLRSDVALDMLMGKQFGGEVKAHVYLYLDALTYAGLRNHPAELAGHGPIPASLARDIASGPKTVFQRIITDPVTGQVVELGRRRYRPKAGLDELVRVRDRECRRPGCTRPAQFGDLDHCDSAGKGWKDGCPTGAATLVGLCRADHKLRDLPGWWHGVADDGVLTITTPAGQWYTSEAEPLGHG
ncbi:DUF222 domain-containing protein [Amycolatopsis sp. YIM 10]|uniref:DUF222 domain-containing protein n=1 Tax=Amycolatopsis sp. YIM 10 TaxID=2653857 RepID=UPI0012A8AD2E|nr:DUF222 domain-containing protein [Amycolatopsis sp. YIM 10]QFU92087.1 hypothetical protein YIM_34630 [Amycolatopsis sp. YIM 10]